MTDQTLYAVFIHHGALEALGDAIKPYLTNGPHGPHVVCREIDSGGAFFEMLLEGTNSEGRNVALELMLPSAMIQMVVSTHSDGAFGFQHRRDTVADAPPRNPGIAPSLPPTHDPLPHEPAIAPAVAYKTVPKPG
ncbi:MAG TPA: hypothetical protein VK660_08705 [Xanthomonadaceae bacterium]|jgi:hypothetical protein|nr:hypothetical protein [Xanthomonadaceae bacterium]